MEIISSFGVQVDDQYIRSPSPSSTHASKSLHVLDHLNSSRSPSSSTRLRHEKATILRITTVTSPTPISTSISFQRNLKNQSNLSHVNLLKPPSLLNNEDDQDSGYSDPDQNYETDRHLSQRTVLRKNNINNRHYRDLVKKFSDVLENDGGRQTRSRYWSAASGGSSTYNQDSHNNLVDNQLTFGGRLRKQSPIEKHYNEDIENDELVKNWTDFITSTSSEHTATRATTIDARSYSETLEQEAKKRRIERDALKRRQEQEQPNQEIPPPRRKRRRKAKDLRKQVLLKNAQLMLDDI